MRKKDEDGWPWDPQLSEDDINAEAREVYVMELRHITVLIDHIETRILWDEKAVKNKRMRKGVELVLDFLEEEQAYLEYLIKRCDAH